MEKLEETKNDPDSPESLHVESSSNSIDERDDEMECDLRRISKNEEEEDAEVDEVHMSE